MVDFNFNLTEREKGWLEGIIDGEGYLAFLLNKNKKSKNGYVWVIYLSVTNTNLKICEKVLQIFSHEGYKGGNITNKNMKNPKHKKAYCFMSRQFALEKILSQIKLVSKERQRELVLKGLEMLKEFRNGEHWMARDGNGRPKEIENEMLKMYEEMKILNKRGRRPTFS